jgi:hypothetical protein
LLSKISGSHHRNHTLLPLAERGVMRGSDADREGEIGAGVFEFQNGVKAMNRNKIQNGLVLYVEAISCGPLPPFTRKRTAMRTANPFVT